MQLRAESYVSGRELPAEWERGVYRIAEQRPAETASVRRGCISSSGTVFQTPTANYATRIIDLSDFGSVTSVGWPFDENAVPINGLLRLSNGSAPFPLALFVHGNHNPSENSTPGYVYLMELLASQGIIAGSVDCNFLNGWNSGENDARAIVHLEHVRQFRIWNQQAGHPLLGKVNLEKIMIIGHSRGGEAVGHACLFNTLSSVTPDPGDPPVPIDGSLGLGPYGFALNVAAAISPTDNQYEPLSGPVKIGGNYFVVHGSRDGKGLRSASGKMVKIFVFP